MILGAVEDVGPKKDRRIVLHMEVAPCGKGQVFHPRQHGREVFFPLPQGIGLPLCQVDVIIWSIGPDHHIHIGIACDCMHYI